MYHKLNITEKNYLTSTLASFFFLTIQWTGLTGDTDSVKTLPITSVLRGGGVGDWKLSSRLAVRSWCKPSVLGDELLLMLLDGPHWIRNSMPVYHFSSSQGNCAQSKTNWLWVCTGNQSTSFAMSTIDQTMVVQQTL